VSPKKKSDAPPPVVVPAELNIEIHAPGVEFLNEEIATGAIGEQPFLVSLANYCRPAVRWKGRCATLDFTGFVRQAICAIEAQLRKEKG
jgi:hypothetical protein